MTSLLIYIKIDPLKSIDWTAEVNSFLPAEDLA